MGYNVTVKIKRRKDEVSLERGQTRNEPTRNVYEMRMEEGGEL